MLLASLGAMAVTAGEMAGFFFVFAYSALLLLAPLYALESGFSAHGRPGRLASVTMFCVSLSLLAAAAGARI